jgi:hypothetical protein
MQDFIAKLGDKIKVVKLWNLSFTTLLNLHLRILEKHLHQQFVQARTIAKLYPANYPNLCQLKVLPYLNFFF